MASSTVLSATGFANFSSASLLAQLNQTFQKKVEATVGNVSNDYQQKINAINLVSKKWQDVGDDAADASSKISGTVGRTKAVVSKIESMIRLINQAEQNTDNIYTGYASAFDSLLGGLINDAEKSSDSPNMLGDGVSRFTYDTGIYNETHSVYGSYLGSGYYITDTDGKIWAVDWDAKLLRRYDEYPDTPSNLSANFETGFRLDSISGDAVSFTTGPDTGAPQSFSGTISRKGLGLLGAIFYEGLETSAGRALALENLNAAKEAANLEKMRYEAELTMAKFYEDRANAEGSGRKQEINDLMIRSAKDIEKARKDLQMEFNNTQSYLARAMALKNDYSNMLSPFLGNKFGKAFINIFA